MRWRTRRFPGRRLLFGAVVAALLVPFHVTALPVFLGLARLQLLNTYTALILPFVATAFGMFLLRQAFSQIPAELVDAARVDRDERIGHRVEGGLSAGHADGDRLRNLFRHRALE